MNDQYIPYTETHIITTDDLKYAYYKGKNNMSEEMKLINNKENKMSRSNIELPQDMLQIYFSDDSPCHDIKVRSDSVDKIMIKDGFLMVHDINDNCWHCYNMNDITHFHYPDHVKGAK